MASLLVLTFYLREGDTGMIHGIRSGVTAVTSPLRVVGSALATPFNALGNIMGNLTASEETLSELRAQNEELTAQVAELSEAAQTSERLESLLGLRSTYNLQSVAARIIGTSGDAWTKTVTIDKGSADGFTVNMPVANSAGVIGQIIEVSATSSVVRLITDENSGVSAMIQSTRAQGMLQGQPDGSLLLSYVPTSAEVSAGDLVVTSGIGGVYPKGLPLGRVSSVESAANALYYTIVVEAYANVENQEEVLVVTSLTEEQTATADDIAEADANPAGSNADDAAQDGADDASQNASGDEPQDSSTAGDEPAAADSEGGE